MILVVGSTGLVGGEICRRLTGRGEHVRALVRSTSDPAKVTALHDRGVETVIGDLRDRASLVKACKGVEAVVTTVSAMPFSYEPGVNDIRITDTDGTLALIDAAAAEGVRRFVYLSFSKNLDVPCPLHEAKRTVEAHLTKSGMDYTILRPSCFMEVWLSPAVGFDPINGKATIYGDGTRPLSWIAAGDVAEFAARAVRAGAARNAILELGGPEPLSPLEAVRAFERAGGRPIEVTHVPEEALEQQRLAATDPMQASFAALMCAYARGDLIEMGDTLTTFPMALTSVSDYAEKVLGGVPVGAA